MVTDRRIQEEVEKTLRAFDEDAGLRENPFLASTILAEKERKTSRHPVWAIVRGNLRYAALFLLFLLNLATFFLSRGHLQVELRDKLVTDLREEFQIDQFQDNF